MVSPELDEFTLVYRWHSMLPDTLIYGGQKSQRTTRNGTMKWLLGRLGALFEESCSQPAATKFI